MKKYYEIGLYVNENGELVDLIPDPIHDFEYHEYRIIGLIEHSFFGIIYNYLL
jgi:hypothetical protein